MLSNNKFLGKCWYGQYPWIRLAVECERMVEKGKKLFSVWEPPMIYLAWKVLGSTRSFSSTGKACHPKCFISTFFRFELWHLYKSLLPSTKGLSFTLCNFYFESPSSLIKHQLRGTMIVLEHWVQLICECVS